MSKKWLVVGLVGVLVFLIGLVGALWATPKFEVVNQLPLKQFRVSSLWGGVYLWKMGYWPEINRVKVVYTSEPQKGYRLTNGKDKQLVQTLWMEKKGKTATVYIHYTPEKFNDISSQPDWFNTDVYAAICLAMEGKQSGYDGCYKKARGYLEWVSNRNIGKVVVSKADGTWRPKFSLVKQAYAQSCSGTIQCGADDWICTCDEDNSSCSSDGASCGTDGTCGCYMGCDLNSGNTLNCSSLDNQDLCWNASVRECEIGCNPSAEKPCKWGGVSNPEDPGDGGGDACGSAAFPACSASCPPGQQCTAIYADDRCQCKAPAVVSDALMQIQVYINSNQLVYSTTADGQCTTGQVEIQGIKWRVGDESGNTQIYGEEHNNWCGPSASPAPYSQVELPLNSRNLGSGSIAIVAPSGYQVIGVTPNGSCYVPAGQYERIECRNLDPGIYGGNKYYLEAVPNQPPTCSVSGDNELCTGEAAVYTANCSDDHGISRVNMHWSPVSTELWSAVWRPDIYLQV